MKKTAYSLLAASSLLWAACIKEDSLPTRYTPIPGANTNMKVYHMSPDAPSFNIFANGVKATSVAPTANNEVLGLTFGSIYPSTATTIGYFTLPSGSVKLDAVVPATSTTTPGATLFSKTETLTAGKFYSYAVVDSLSRLSTVLVEDDPAVPFANKAYFRWANFIPNGSVKVQIVKTSTGSFPYSKEVNPLPFKTVSNFDSISAGSGEIYRVYLLNAANNQKLDSVSSLAPTPTKKYTFYTRGVVGQTGSSNTKRPLIFSVITF